MIPKIDFLFFCPNIQEHLFLEQNDSQHAVKVLRKKRGDEIQISDGFGNLYFCVIQDANAKKCSFEIINEIKEFQKPNRHIEIAICPTKNIDRMAYFVEKSVEIGVTAIHFILSQNTYLKRVNTERMHKIAVSALKQSVKAYLPQINEAIKFEAFMKYDVFDGLKYIAQLNDGSVALENQKGHDKTLILIGPEGDFSKTEMELALQNNYKPVSLGQSRLRTETAGIVAVTLLNFIK